MTEQTSRTTIADLLDAARSRLDRLEPVEALAAQREGALLVDTRSQDERRREGVIPGSLHIPLSVLPWRLDPDADPAFRNAHVRGLDQHLVLVCAHGYSTSLAAALLQELGFTRATDLAGGFVAWREAGLPVAELVERRAATVPGMGDPEPT
ncbi:MAG TPA: rhodanese-like domain-containing protein [Gaiellaceae bacterium]|nr:rhodanese-like domain-containing protein [Gaiellaceae bacterium]